MIMRYSPPSDGAGVMVRQRDFYVKRNTQLRVVWAEALSIITAQRSEATITNCLAIMRWRCVYATRHKSTSVCVHTFENLSRNLVASTRGWADLSLPWGSGGVTCIDPDNWDRCIAAAPATLCCRGGSRPDFLNCVMPIYSF